MFNSSEFHFFGSISYEIHILVLFNEHALENHFESKVLFKSADETLVDVSDIINSTIKDNLGPSQHFVRTIFETKYQSSKTIH